MMRKEAVIIGGLALIGAYLYFQGEGEKSKGDNQFLTGGGYIPKKMIPPVEPPVEPTSSNITYNIQFPELNIPQYTPSFTSEPSPKTKKSKSKTSRDIPVSPSTGSPIMIPDTSPKTIREHIIVPYAEFTGGEKIPVVTKKGEIGTLEIKKADIKVDIPPLKPPTPPEPMTKKSLPFNLPPIGIPLKPLTDTLKKGADIVANILPLKPLTDTLKRG